ncbi:hypothetical protein AVEN_6383-1 [Araneus ventricosus]|uniref:Uncharacterized protein n=1 Tax=Araneus ventricosus TaxID=182803 RepID=A0A4Y2T9I2_ARAVE|nr:hypothetical protein AVEN_6383-1 [Araneus ventricosus]
MTKIKSSAKACNRTFRCHSSDMISFATRFQNIGPVQETCAHPCSCDQLTVPWVVWMVTFLSHLVFFQPIGGCRRQWICHLENRTGCDELMQLGRLLIQSEILLFPVQKPQKVLSAVQWVAVCSRDWHLEHFLALKNSLTV